MLGCTAALAWMRHDRGGAILDLGRRRRRPNAALRKAARERDTCRCRFPGCESRRVDLHHIRYWRHGGRTGWATWSASASTITCWCTSGGTSSRRRRAARSRSTGPTAPPCRPARPCPRPAAPSRTATTPTITPETIIPPWYGERLDLDEAIYICLANARTPQERQDQRDQADDPDPFRPRKWVVEPSDWIRYLNEHTAA